LPERGRPGLPATMHEMRALLLELRLVALEGAGLVPALEELCHAYRDRLGCASTSSSARWRWTRPPSTRC